MRRWILLVVAALWLLPHGALAAPTYEGTDTNPGQKPKDVIWHRLVLDTSTTQSRNFALGQSCSVKFTKAGSGNVVLYEVPTSSAAYTSGVAETTFTASTSAAYTFAPGLSYGTIRAASDSDGSIVEITCLNTGTFSGGGGGVVGVGDLTAMNAYANPQGGDLWQQTDDDSTGDCASSGTEFAFPVLLCQYDANTSAWVPAGIAGGTDNLGNHTATTNLDMAGNDLDNVGDVNAAGAVISGDLGDGTRGINMLQNTAALDEPASSRCKLGLIGRILGKRCNGEDYVQIEGQGEAEADGGLTVEPMAWIRTVLGGASDGNINTKVYLNPDGAKNYPACTDTTPADGFCDSDTTDRPGKSTVAQEYVNVYGISQSEMYAKNINLYCGGDADCINMFIRTWCTGGSQDGGDEGCSGFRNGIYDHFGTASGSTSDAVASGAAKSTLTNLSGLTEPETKMVGENKLIVWTGDAQDVNIVTRANGAVNSAEAYQTSGSGGAWGASSGGEWVLGSGEGALVAATGYCFRGKLSDFTDYFSSDAGQAWLPIVGVSTDTITTQWISQAIDYRVPSGYLADDGADDTTYEGAIAPCAVIDDNPTIDSSYLVTAIPIATGAGFPGVSGGTAFTIHPYPGVTTVIGNSSRVGKMYGAPGFPNGSAYLAMNSIQTGVGRMQVAAAFRATYNTGGPSVSTNLADGNYHAFERGLECGSGVCEVGVYYVYTDTSGITQYALRLDMPDTDWAADSPIRIAHVVDAGTSNNGNTTMHLTLDKTNGWGMNNDPFLTAARTQTITGAKTITGTYDFNGGIVLLPYEADCSDNTGNGEACVDSDDGSFWIEGVNITGAGGGDVGAVGDCTSGACFSGVGGTGTTLSPLGNFTIDLDDDNNGSNTFSVRDGANTTVLLLAESGTLALLGAISNTGGNITSEAGILVSGKIAVNRGELNLWGGTSNLYNYGILPPTTGTANLDLILPPVSPTDTQRLCASGTAGQLAWCDAGGSGSSIWTDRGTHLTTLGPLLVGGDEDDVAEAGETLISGGDVTADSFTARPHATDGGQVVITEGADDGTNTVSIKVPDSGLSANKVHALTAEGLFPAGSISQTFTECFPIYAPVDTIAASDDIQSLWRAPAAITITEVWCETDTGTVDMDLQIDDGTPGDVMGTDLTCASTAVSDSTSLTGSMADGDRLDLAITSVASSPTRLTVCAEYVYQ